MSQSLQSCRKPTHGSKGHSKVKAVPHTYSCGQKVANIFGQVTEARPQLLEFAYERRQFFCLWKEVLLMKECQDLLENKMGSPGWCASVDWVPACKPKGHWFDSHSGHMPGLWVRCPVGGHVRGNHALMFLFLSPSLSPSLKING